MAMTEEENRLLTRVEKGAPLGDMIRQCFWVPVAPSAVLEAGGKPLRVRLLGADYVAFRGSGGGAGVLDEACPHRKASLALGRNENDSLRCIYHGWRFGLDGSLVEAPNHHGDQEKFCRSIRVGRYRVQEKGGIVWAWFGKGDSAPAFPDLPFTALPASQRSVTTNLVPTNWLQAVEASLDSSHVSFLHETTTKMAGSNQRSLMNQSRAPRFDFEERPYGYRYAAIRELPGNKSYVRINNYVAPWYAIVCAPEETGPATVFFSVPVDDTHHRAWFVHFNPHRELGMTALSATPDPWRWPPLPPGGADDNWGQNRDLMKRGHFSGFPQHLATEDFAVFLSQGPILDRSDEQLCSADMAIVRLRRMLLEAVREFADGRPPRLAASSGADYARAVSVGGVIAAGEDWRALADGKTSSAA